MSATFLNRIKTWHWLAPWCYRFSILLFAALILWPIIQPELASTSWLMLLCAALLMLCSGAILSIARQTSEHRKGFKAWLLRTWHKLLFWLWLATVCALLYFSFSVIRFALTNG